MCILPPRAVIHDVIHKGHNFIHGGHVMHCIPLLHEIHYNVVCVLHNTDMSTLMELHGFGTRDRQVQLII